ncbi:SERTA domain-containing protein 3 [Paramarasmius palmivorus]|uniref:SERTA domain-containing protein 3 n=1 Tax=Paramarasmius palmivorus TaxID=297713 RepID=A0AAW0CS41_9AGAR
MPRQHGARLEYLESKVPGYFVAVQGGYGPEYIARVVAGYLRRFRPDKGEDYEPTSEELAAIDDDNVEDEEWLLEPVRREDEVLEQFRERVETFKDLKVVVAAKIDQVERWMRYRYRKQAEANMKESDAYRKLLSKLTGLDISPGRRRPPYVEWGRANPELADDLVRRYLNSKDDSSDEMVLRADAVKEGYSFVPPEDRKVWKQKAYDRFLEEAKQGIHGACLPARLLWAEEHSMEVDQRVKVAVAEKARSLKFVKKGGEAYVAVRQEVLKREFETWKEEDKEIWRKKAQEIQNERVEKCKQLKSAPYSTTPEDRQRAIDRLGPFITPILEGMAEATGWKFTLIGGGPEPIDGGRLNTTAVHVGVTSGPVPLTFGAMFRPQIKQSLNTYFGSFLKKCYSVSECQSRAMATPAVPRTEEMEDPSGAIVRDTIEDQGSRGTSSSASGTNVANVASSKPIPSTSKTIPSASNSTSTSSLPKQASLPLKPICPPPINSTTASSSRSKPYARIMAPAAAPRLPPQGSATMSAVAKGKDTESRPSNAQRQNRAASPISVAGSPPPPSSPSVAPPSLPPPSPISIRSSPEPEPPIRGSGVADSPINIPSSLAAPVTRTYKDRKRTTASGMSPSKAARSDARRRLAGSSKGHSPAVQASSSGTTRSTFVGVVLPARGATASSSRAHKSGKHVEDDDMATELSSVTAAGDGGPDDVQSKGTGKKRASLASDNALKRKRTTDGGAASAPPRSSTSSDPAPTAKRRKTETARAAAIIDPIPDHVPHMVSTPAGCADYVRTVLSICHEVQMDRQLRDVVANWVRLDSKPNYKGPRLSATDRPSDIGWWIARARPVGYQPKKMQDLQGYAHDFTTWYRNCSPSWRTEDSSGFDMPRSSGGDWSSLARFGPNGIVNFVVGLAWWKGELKKLPCRTPREQQFKGSQLALYKAALDEVDYTFRCLGEAGY